MAADDDTLCALGRTARRMRRERDLSQEALASLAGVHTNQIGRMERAVGDVYASTLVHVFDALGVPLLDAILAYHAQHTPSIVLDGVKGTQRPVA